MARLVRDDGSPHARLVLIGEAPGATEEATGLPFVGASGLKLTDWWRQVGLTRADFYITNVYPYRPPGNKIEAIPKQDLLTWTHRLHDQIAALTDPWVLVPTGNTALTALTGKHGILKHRGSIYEYHDRRGRTLKVIPTVHPAAIFRTPRWERRCRQDWVRIAEDATFRETRLPQREHLIRPTLADVENYVQLVLAQRSPVSLDIETPGGTIVCIGFSETPTFSITIPTTISYWGETLPRIWDAIRRLCESPVPKVTQNGHYDAYWLAHQGITLAAWDWDCLAMHHALDATEDHSLAYMASVDTREPYWKDEAKDPAEAAKYASNLAALWVYNGKDTAVQRELMDVYHARLTAEGRLAFYIRHYRALFQPVLSMMLQGLRLDSQARRRRWASLYHQCITLQDQMAVLAGAPLHTTARNKKRDATGKLPDLSSKKVATYFYQTLGLPVQRDRKTGGVTTKEIVVRQLMLRHPAKASTIGQHILDYRRTRKLMEFLDEGQVDADGRVRCTFKFTTDTGRFASSKSPRGTGRNLQNVDREIRDTFVPEPGWWFVEADLSQAEDRIVKMLAAAVTSNAALRDRARAQPWENDEHRRAAAIIFKHPTLDAVTKHERYLGKRVRHATNYGMGGRTLSEDLLKDGLTLTTDECDRMIQAIHHADPEIQAWQAAVRQQVLHHRALVNSWGRMRTFDHERLDDEAYRSAYAFVPQSEVPDLINQYGLVPVASWLHDRRSRLHLQVHDSLLLSCPIDEMWDVMHFLATSLARPRRIGGESLVIPVEFKVGRTWAGELEFKRFPSLEELMDKLAQLELSTGPVMATAP
jgi:uracil-DNA glycosylase family 4